MALTRQYLFAGALLLLGGCAHQPAKPPEREPIVMPAATTPPESIVAPPDSVGAGATPSLTMPREWQHHNGEDYDDLFDRLGLDQVDLIGHSFGGMVAAEYAATFRDRVGKLVLIDAMGLWHDDAPVADHLLVSPQNLVKLLFHDPSKPEVAAKLAMPSDRDAMNAAIVYRFGALASTSHFIHPIPERGLKRRLRRIKAETLVLWGAQDALVPPSYAAEFAALIPNARVEMIQAAGHVPQIEQRRLVSDHLTKFLTRG